MSRVTDGPPLQLLVGPAGHGVVRYAADVATAVAHLDPRTASISVAGIDTAGIDTAGIDTAGIDTAGIDAALAAVRSVPAVHLHVTDRLLGSSPEEAARNLERLAEVTRLSITLHDVPQASDGTGRERRIAAYRRFFAAAAAVAVNSGHEQDLVSEYFPGVAPPQAIPLGARRPAPLRLTPVRTEASESPALIVLLAGYIYPGKGHAGAIRAAAEAAENLAADGETVGDVIVRAIGGSSAGHDADVEDLRAEAERLGVRFEVTGFLDDDAFAGHLGGPGIPLAAHEHVSASRSMLDWVEIGRRPLVVESRYAQEMADLRPGTMSLYRPEALAARLAERWRHPEMTELEPGISLSPTLSDVAARYLLWWRMESDR